MSLETEKRKTKKREGETVRQYHLTFTLSIQGSYDFLLLPFSIAVDDSLGFV